MPDFEYNLFYFDTFHFDNLSQLKYIFIRKLIVYRNHPYNFENQTIKVRIDNTNAMAR